MQALPTLLFSAAVGFYLNGVLGLTIGAGFGWVCCLIAVGIEEKLSRQRDAMLASIVERLDMVQADLGKLNAAAARGVALHAATLDASPVEHYDILDMQTPRTAEDWQVVYASKWKLIRRRLVVAHGLRADAVDAAQQCLMDQHAAGSPLPQSDEALVTMVEAWKRAEVWAREFAARHTTDQGAEE